MESSFLKFGAKVVDVGVNDTDGSRDNVGITLLDGPMDGMDDNDGTCVMLGRNVIDVGRMVGMIVGDVVDLVFPFNVTQNNEVIEINSLNELFDLG